MTNPEGIRILGARVVNGLDLSHLRVPFPLVLRRCLIPERIKVVGTEIRHLDLDGSYSAEIEGRGLIVHSDLDLGKGFHASGEIDVENARIDGDLDCEGGQFQRSAVQMPGSDALERPALDASGAVVTGSTYLCCGFKANGAVLMLNSSLANGLMMFGGQFSNPNEIALWVAGSDIVGGVYVGGNRAELGFFEANGKVDFTTARVKPFFMVWHARFTGSKAEDHGFIAVAMTVDGPLSWNDVELRNGALLDLSAAKIGPLNDEEKSWPEPGKLRIDGFTYERFAPKAPSDAISRLRWIGLQGAQFHPQPYSQLAAVYRGAGADREAVEVLVAKDDARYAQFRSLGRLWGGFLKYTIGYGHRPFLALLWSLAMVLVGWIVVAIAKGAGVMRLTWPETTPLPAGSPTVGLHPLLYSLDVFLPFVNLHQEHYWWPDESASGEYPLLGYNINIRGSILRYYLWLQIIAGWLLSAIFVAGVTGLMRND